MDKHTTTTISINDATLTIKKLAGLKTATGIDALTHAIEVAFQQTPPITDALQMIPFHTNNCNVEVILLRKAFL